MWFECGPGCGFGCDPAFSLQDLVISEQALEQLFFWLQHQHSSQRSTSGLASPAGASGGSVTAKGLRNLLLGIEPPPPPPPAPQDLSPESSYSHGHGHAHSQSSMVGATARTRCGVAT